MWRVERVAELREMVTAARQAGQRVGFVPTMGYLHEGHLRLVDEARRRADVVVMSIFVNPLQFGPKEDLSRYPRDLDGDSQKAAARGVDVLFLPDEATMYAEKPRVIVTAPDLARRWEGASRPGHFDGVLTVVAKLFNLVQPHVAIFGQKDVQQSVLVRAMTRDLDFPVEIIVAPTVREPDGLAMSSRNAYLTSDERTRAVGLSAALRAVEVEYAGGERAAETLQRTALDAMAAHGVSQVDYIAIADPHTLEPVAHASSGTIVAVAARVGTTRLIDNVILGGA
jgi:pantoate--beta-alanine ligase